MDDQAQRVDPQRFTRFLNNFPQPTRFLIGLIVGSVLYEGAFFLFIDASRFIGLLSPSDYLYLTLSWLPFLILGFALIFSFAHKHIAVFLMTLLPIWILYLFPIPVGGLEVYIQWYTYVFERSMLIPLMYMAATLTMWFINSSTTHWYVVWFLVAIVAQGWLDASRASEGARPYVLQLKEGQPPRLVLALRVLERGVLVRDPRLNQIQFFPWEAVEFISKPFAEQGKETPEA